jgi:hypothetical protein
MGTTKSRTGDYFIETDFDFDPSEKVSAVSIPRTESTTPEELLWIAVLGQIVDDATHSTCKVGERMTVRAEVEARHARAQVFASIGTTAEDFNQVCDMAGFDPSFVRRCIKAAIDKNVQVTRETFMRIAVRDSTDENT